MRHRSTALAALVLGLALAACAMPTQHITCTDVDTKEVVLQKQGHSVSIDSTNVRVYQADGGWRTYLLPQHRLLECTMGQGPPS